jgi:hypothetical protein
LLSPITELSYLQNDKKKVTEKLKHELLFQLLKLSFGLLSRISEDMRVQRITVMHESKESLKFTHVEVECNLLEQMRFFLFDRKQMGLLIVSLKILVAILGREREKLKKRDKQVRWNSSFDVGVLQHENERVW